MLPKIDWTAFSGGARDIAKALLAAATAAPAAADGADGAVASADGADDGAAAAPAEGGTAASAADAATKLPASEADADALIAADELGFLRIVHLLLLDVHIQAGALICPESGRRFPINEGVPNMLLHEDEI